MASAFSRRSFLAQGALAAGAALSARAQETPAASPTAASETPANKIRLAVIGTNGRGAALATSFTKQSGAEVIWICDVDDQAAAKGVQAVVSAGGKQPRSGRDLRRVLDDQDVDAVVIATPDHWHAPAAILAC
ncbi:MAG: Gfo/Idh/MocA family oxidoreductase, partial [Planctomycetaceae bacterium]|nr:Gfo/Idh/MocA family oxidoreductase [Planctomycetaceae bacterium]